MIAYVSYKNALGYQKVNCGRVLYVVMIFLPDDRKKFKTAFKICFEKRKKKSTMGPSVLENCSQSRSSLSFGAFFLLINIFIFCTVKDY